MLVPRGTRPLTIPCLPLALRLDTGGFALESTFKSLASSQSSLVQCALSRKMRLVIPDEPDDDADDFDDPVEDADESRDELSSEMPFKELILGTKEA